MFLKKKLKKIDVLTIISLFFAIRRKMLEYSEEKMPRKSFIVVLNEIQNKYIFIRNSVFGHFSETAHQGWEVMGKTA